MTLAALVLSGVMKAPVMTQQNSVSARSVRISKSFYYFAFNIPKLNIEESSFHDFLDSAITFDSVQRLYKGHYLVRPDVPGLGDDIVIKASVFENCHAKLDGGAISHFSQDVGTLTCVGVTFVNCTSGPNPSDGGCIYFSGESSRIDRCCAFRCRAGRDGHSFCISIKGGQETPNHVNRSTSIECAPVKEACGWQSLYLGFGKIRLADYNSTKNAVTTQAGSFMMHTIDSDAIALHLTVVNNVGPWIVYFFGRQGSIIDRSNFISNVCINRDESGGIFHFHKYGMIKDCYVSGNIGQLFKKNRADASLKVMNTIFDVAMEEEPDGVSFDPNCRFDEPFIETLELAHLNTFLCHGVRNVEEKPISK